MLHRQTESMGMSYAGGKKKVKMSAGEIVQGGRKMSGGGIFPGENVQHPYMQSRCNYIMSAVRLEMATPAINNQLLA